MKSILPSVVLALITINSGAEEYLKKSGNEYLGWQVSPTEFRACSGTRLKIGDGQIESTSEKCPGSPILSAYTGTIVKLSTNKQVVTIDTTTGKKEFFVPKKTINQSDVKSIKIGQEVTIKSPIEGRASSISVK